MILLVLPAYNEEAAIVSLLERVKKFQESREAAVSIRIIVVDDGSRDQTAERVEAFRGLPITLIRHEKNMGLSGAIKTGLSYAVEAAQPDDIIVTMDSDDTHGPALMKSMLERIEQGYNVVIASRYLHDSRIVGLSRFREFLSYGASLLFRLAFPIRGVRDYTCGYRAYEARIIKEAFERWKDDFISEEGFTCMVDILLKLRQMDCIFVEVPMVLRYDRKPGVSKMNVPRTIRRTLYLLVRRRLGLP